MLFFCNMTCVISIHLFVVAEDIENLFVLVEQPVSWKTRDLSVSLTLKSIHEVLKKFPDTVSNPLSPEKIYLLGGN